MRAILAIDLHSATKEQVLSEAGRFAEQLGATLDVMFVDGMPYLEGFVTDPTVSAVLEREAENLKAHHEQLLLKLVGSLPDMVRGKAVSRYGFAPAEAIVEASEGYDLLMVATHGRTGLRHLMLGSVAERVLRHAKVPTLVLRVTGDA